MPKRKYQKPLHIDVPFEEALERFAQTDPEEADRAAAEGDGRVAIVLDEGTGDRLAIYATPQGLRVEAHFDGAELRMTQAQMSDLFGRDQSVIARHLKRIEQMDGLPPGTLYADSAYKGANGQAFHRRLYTLDAIIYVGFRVNSPQGILFRRWASETLGQILTKGFYIDTKKLKGDADHFAELREIIRDIRADEANIYAELRRILAMCQDYDPASEATHLFFAHFQNRLLYAITGHTSAELITSRADAAKPNMGLMTWDADRDYPLQTDTTTSKNYLGDLELKDLNRLVGMVLDFFEDQTERGWLVSTNDADGKLEEILTVNKRKMLQGFGAVSAKDAERHAKAQYKKFDAERRQERKRQALAELNEKAKRLPRKKSLTKSGG